MRRKIGTFSVLAPLPLIAAILWLYRPAAGQTGSSIPAQARQAAGALLDSPTAQYLSGSGLAALGIISGRTPVPAASAARLAAVPSVTPPSSNPIVNDPALDLLSAQDVTTQSESSGAGHQNIVIVAYNDSGDFPFINSFTGYSRSTTGGETFRDMGPVRPAPGGLVLGDPSAAANLAGHFFIANLAFDPALPLGFNQTIGISRSTDGGLTFAPPVYIPNAGLTPFAFPDKEMLTVDTTRGAYSGNIYVTYTAFQNIGSPIPGFPIAFSRSTDGGLSFSPPIILSNPGELNQGSEPVVGPDGTIYVAWYRIAFGPPAILVAKSTDGGLSFGPPVVAAFVSPIGFGGGTLKGNFRVNSFPRIDVNREGGGVIVVFNSNPPAFDDGADVYAVVSNDKGVTWSTPMRLNDDRTTTDQFFPDVATNARGDIRVIWYDTRNSPSLTNVMIDVYSAVSTNKGVSFSSNERITDRSFPPAVGFDPITNRVYMGDYIDIKAALSPTGLLNRMLLDWGDNRNVIVTLGGERHDQDVAFTRRN
jgi:hypothetical protein